MACKASLIIKLGVNMLIIPEIETVIILVPRTGSGSLRKAVAAAYPKTMQLYRHMEADGVPPGYDHWPRWGVVRHPLDRLWSLFKFLQGDISGDYEPAWIEKMKQAANRPFEDWLMNNDVPFTHPYDSSGEGRFFPRYTVRHPIAENRKSQRLYLRPDLNTNIIRYEKLDSFANFLGVRLGTENSSPVLATPRLSIDAERYMRRWFAWDYKETE